MALNRLALLAGRPGRLWNMHLIKPRYIVFPYRQPVDEAPRFPESYTKATYDPPGVCDCGHPTHDCCRCGPGRAMGEKLAAGKRKRATAGGLREHKADIIGAVLQCPTTRGCGAKQAAKGFGSLNHSNRWRWVATESRAEERRGGERSGAERSGEERRGAVHDAFVRFR